MNFISLISAICIMGLLLATFLANGQEKFQRWGGGVDDETIHFGFSFHYVNADYKITLKPDWQTPDPMASTGDTRVLLGVSSPFYQGVGLGLLADVKLTENSNLRFTPSLIFSNKAVNYRYERSPAQPSDPADEFVEKLIRASYIDLPLLFKFKSDRKGNYRGYLIGGGKYSINVVSGKRYDDSQLVPAEKYLKTKPGYFSYEAGIGFDLYFDFFKMSPEVRWVQSVGNLLDRSEYNMYNRPIDGLMLRNFQVSLFFE